MSGPGRTIEHLTGSPVLAFRPLHGGDLSDVQLAELADGRRIVVKTGPMTDREARMLAALAAAGAPVPQVLGTDAPHLLLQALEETGSSPAGWAALGRALRALHGAAPAEDLSGGPYGWAEDYAFGAVEIPNAAQGDWPAFWASQRLLAAPEALPRDLRRRIEALSAGLSGLLPAAPPAALLHGDLWTGNVLFSGGQAYLIDPACYYGHAEVDLAMLQLFGSPPDDFWAAYGPLAPGHEIRTAIYQLWPALVHLRLFGSSYRHMVEGLLERSGF